MWPVPWGVPISGWEPPPVEPLSLPLCVKSVPSGSCLLTKILKLILYVIHLIYFSDGGLCQYPLYSVFQRAELVYITVCHGYVAGEYLSPEKGKFRIVGNTQIPTDRITEK